METVSASYDDWLEKLDLCVALVHKVDVRAEDRAEAFEQLVGLSRSDAYCRAIISAMIAWRTSQIIPSSAELSSETNDQQFGQVIVRALTARLRAIHPAVSIETASHIITALVSAFGRADELMAHPDVLGSYALRLKGMNTDGIDATLVTLAVGLIDPAGAGDMIEFIATEPVWKVAAMLAD